MIICAMVMESINQLPMISIRVANCPNPSLVFSGGVKHRLKKCVAVPGSLCNLTLMTSIKLLDATRGL